MNHPWDLIITASVVVAAIGGLVKFLRLDDVLHGTRTFLLDWNGMPERKGVEAIPSFPERMSNVERSHEGLNARMDSVGEGVARIERSAGENNDALRRLDFRVNGIDKRITDHRRRNEQQIESLRAEVERRMNTTDGRLAKISGDLLKSETMRAILVELGIPIDPDDVPGDER